MSSGTSRHPSPPRGRASWTIAGAAVALVAALAGCAVETPPSIPGAPERRAAVVPARRAGTGPDGGDAGDASCAASCPSPREGEELAGCHPSRLDRRVAAHRGALGEPPDEWVVCYFEAR